MDAEPRMDASRPSNLRLAAFALTAIGALVMGIGSLITWVTYGVHLKGDVPTVVPGTDTTQGRIALASAVAMLVTVILVRVAHGSRRQVLAVVAGTLALVGGAASVWFLLTATDSYGPLSGASQAAAADLGAYTTIGAGPYVVILGMALATFGAVLTLRWAQRLRTNEEAGRTAPSDAPASS